MKLQTKVVFLFILFAILSRFVPHMQNFSPILAIGLFGASHFQNKWMAFFIPLVATFLSDMIFGWFVYPENNLFYDGMVFTYISYILVISAGLVMLRKINAYRVIGTSIFASVIFFLGSNIGCWIGNPMYPQTLAGMNKSLIAGIPFYTGTILGTLVFSVILFGGYYLLRTKWYALRSEKALSIS